MITITGTSLELDVKLTDHHKYIGEVYDKRNKILYRGKLLSIAKDSRGFTLGVFGSSPRQVYDIEVEFKEITEVKS